MCFSCKKVIPFTQEVDYVNINHLISKTKHVSKHTWIASGIPWNKDVVPYNCFIFMAMLVRRVVPA